MEKLRAYWSHRQGLDGWRFGSDPASVLAQTGWARSVGGANPYLQIYARCGVGRQAVDADVAAMRIHELPSARGCTYVLPAEHYAVGLLCGQGFGEEATIQSAKKYLGVTDGELDALNNGVLAALKRGPLDPRNLKAELGALVRNLGDEGKKRGQTTTLPLALGSLQATGRIRRIPENGRIDQQRYSYSLWENSPLEGDKRTPADGHAELARLYWKWAGPASFAHFRWFSGLGVAAAKVAVSGLNLVPLKDDLMILAEEVSGFEQFQASSEPHYSLVSATDGHLLLRRDVNNLVDDKDKNFKTMGEKGLVQVGHLLDLHSHAILDRGRLVGLWEFDPEHGTMAWLTFDKPSDDLRAAVLKTESFVRDELGDARSFSLDSPESRKPKIEAMRGVVSK